jgi:type I restriction enzyme S subunit
MELSAPTNAEVPKEFPPDWRVVPLGTLIKSVEYGSSAKSAGAGRVPVLRMGNLQSGQIDWNDLVFTSNEAEIKKYGLKQGDVLFNRTNTIDLVGKTSLFDASRPAIFAGYLIRVNVQHELLNTRYLTYVLNSNRARQYGKQVLSVAVGQANINGQKLKTYPIPIPPTKAEQDAIAAVLEDSEQMIASLERLIAKKRQIKQAAMQELLTGKRRLPGFVTPWTMKLIGEFTDCTAGGTPSTSVDGYWGGTIRWMASGDLHFKRVAEVQGRITELGLSNSSTKLIPAKCVLIGLAGQGKTRGTVAINLVPLCTNQSIAGIFPNAKFVPEYLFHNLDSRYEELRELSAGDGGRGGLNLKIIKSIPVPFPCFDEQLAIATVLDEIDEGLRVTEIKLEKVRLVKHGIVQTLLAGKIRLV